LDRVDVKIELLPLGRKELLNDKGYAEPSRTVAARVAAARDRAAARLAGTPWQLNAEDLTARIAEAEREGWLGEVEGLKVSLAGAEGKLAQIGRRSRTGPVDLSLLQAPPAPLPT